MSVVVTQTAEQTWDFAARVAALVRAGDVLVLSGDLGAGKTTFTKGFAAALGVVAPVTSPTFTLVHTYDGSALRIHHLDVYRLDRTGELFELGLDEMLEDEAVMVVEWGDVVMELLGRDVLELRFSHGAAADERRIETVAHGSLWAGRLAAADRQGGGLGC